MKLPLLDTCDMVKIYLFQVSHIGGADYMVVAVKADDVDAAVQRFGKTGHRLSRTQYR